MKIEALQTAEGMFSLVEFNDDAKFIDAFGLDLRDKGSVAIIEEIITNQIDAYSAASGFVLDPSLSLQVFADKKIDLGIGLTLDEPQAEHDPLALPHLIGNWGVEQIRNNYACAVLTLYYHPEEEAALKKKQFLAEIHDYCQYEKIDLIVKLVIYTPANQKFTWESFRQDQLTAVEELRSLAQLFVLQYPNDSLACATLTTSLDSPWVMSDTNLDYVDFKEQLRDGLENGAKGFMIGECLFKEIESMRQTDHSPDLEKINQFIKTTSRDRIIELNRIVKEFS